MREEVSVRTHDQKLNRVIEARLKGYEGDPCSACGHMTLVRNGTCLKCDTCGTTTGCSRIATVADDIVKAYRVEPGRRQGTPGLFFQ